MEDALFTDAPQPKITLAPEPQSIPETSERIQSGKSLPDEPKQEEIVSAVQNDPDQEFIVELGGKKYVLVELTLLNWRKYLAVFAPRFEEVIKNVLPLVGIGMRSFTIWRHLNSDVREKLRTAARDGDTELLQETIHELGIVDYKFEDVATLQNAAKSGDEVGFLVALATIFLGPMAGSTFDVIKQLSFSKMFIELDESFPELVLASIKSSLIRSKQPINEEELKAEIELMDGMDLFEIIHKQYQLYSKRGKIRRFFELMMAMKNPNTSTETPSESMTGTIPS